MRTRSTIAALAVAAFAQALAGSEALAQPDLPPPPPPPMALPSELPPPPVPPRPSPAPPAARAPSPPSSPATSPVPASSLRSPPPAATSAPARRPGAPPPRRRRPEVIFVAEEPRRRVVAFTLDPLGLVFGRVSGGAELLFWPHHSVVASPNVLLFQADRGGRYSLVSEGLGFATHDSVSLGLELGYHYWLRAVDSLRGIFLGPSLLLGTTTQSSVDPSRAQGYWGFAFDVGEQEVLRGGFTIGGGAGVGVLRMNGATALFPRLLLQVGWSP